MGLNTNKSGAVVKQHRSRKNPHAAEEWRARKKEQNAERGKQVYVDGKWVRE